MDLIYQFSALFVLILPLAMLIVLLVFMNNMNKRESEPKKILLQNETIKSSSGLKPKLLHVMPLFLMLPCHTR